MTKNKTALGVFSFAVSLLTATTLLSAPSEISDSEKERKLGPIFHDRSDTSRGANATVGRYLYTGDVPRFAAKDLELYVSKVSLTLRVKAWVPANLPSQYKSIMLARWNTMFQAFNNDSMSFIPMVSPQDALNSAKLANDKAWILAASKYMANPLEQYTDHLYARGVDPDAYKVEILNATLKSFLLDADVGIEDGLSMAASLPQGTASADSSALFYKHFPPGQLFTADTSRGPGYAGFITLVYPIAATTEGPFSLPKEGVKTLGIPGSIEARWHSDKWQDEFGGFPFLMITVDGVAFHGPITNSVKNQLPTDLKDVWYLRRDYVSHGCHRMDSSDVMELRALLPADITSLKNWNLNGVKIQEMEWPDITDFNNDGKPEVMDIAYYGLPGAIGVAKGQTFEQAAAPFFPENRRRTYWADKLKRWGGRTGASFDLNTMSVKGTPVYKFDGKNLSRAGVHGTVPLHSFQYRGNRIIQYRENGIEARLTGYNDNAGKFSPTYFNRNY